MYCEHPLKKSALYIERCLRERGRSAHVTYSNTKVMVEKSSVEKIPQLTVFGPKAFADFLVKYTETPRPF